MKTHWINPTDALKRRFIYPDAGEEEKEEEVLVRRLGFKVGELGLLIAENTISELTDATSICDIPNTANWLLGLTNLRGNLVPIFELKILLGFPLEQEKKRMLLVLEQGEEAVGIPIDALPSQQTFRTDDKLNSLPALPNIIKDYIPSGYEQSGMIWFNFDHKAFFQSLSARIAA